MYVKRQRRRILGLVQWRIYLSVNNTYTLCTLHVAYQTYIKIEKGEIYVKTFKLLISLTNEDTSRDANCG